MIRHGAVRTVVLHLFYDAVYGLGLILGLPYLVFKMATRARFRAGLAQRFGRIPRRGGEEPCLWVHGVSVGELLAATKFVSLFRESHPQWKIVISTTTRAGHAVARERFPEHDVIYYPLDLSPVVRRVFRKIRPSLVILIELEIWPNFLLVAGRRGVPVALINGRISGRSFRGYRVWRNFLAEPMEHISLFCVQNENYAARLKALGVPGEKVLVTGTMKYDTIVTEGVDTLRREMINQLGIDGHSTVLIGGSTHPPEERILLDVYRRLVDRFPGLFLILAPRRPERFDEVEEEIRGGGLRPVRRSRIGRGGPRGDREVLLVDTIGELNQIYAAADMVFVGGSLVPHGGQNMMEPAGLGKAVLFGPSIENFQDSVDLLLAEDAAVMVRDPEDLERVLLGLLGDLELVRDMGERARRIVRENQGASRRNLEILEDLFRDVIETDAASDGSERSAVCRVP
jgi:3-deoxy-D-manno-octulosonic-acid transferase